MGTPENKTEIRYVATGVLPNVTGIVADELLGQRAGRVLTIDGSSSQSIPTHSSSDSSQSRR
jgi:hypothetical protein